MTVHFFEASPDAPNQSAWGAALVAGIAFALLALFTNATAAEPVDVIQRIKGSVVAVGTLDKSRNPAFAFHGTGFVVGDGSLVATNAHVVPQILDSERRESLAIALPSPTPSSPGTVRLAKIFVIDDEHDLALIRIEGGRLPSVALGDSARAREGQSCLFTGFPIGTVLGLFPATHRAMVSAVTPIAIPRNNAGDLNPRAVKQLSTGAYPILQLDATAYPGNSGSPLYDSATGEVLGIINMVFVKSTRESALSQPSGIAYAIPVQPLKDLLQANK
jgi:S1-C subfamily serine protease